MAYIIFVSQPKQGIGTGSSGTITSQAKTKNTALKPILPNPSNTPLGSNPDTSKLIVLRPKVFPTPVSTANSIGTENQDKSNCSVSINSAGERKPFGCGGCERRYKYRKDVRKHVKKAHPDKPHLALRCNQLEDPEAEQILFTCRGCDRSYKCYKSLQKHVKDIHPNEPHFDPRWNQVKVYKFPCGDCPRAFNHMKHFKEHRRVFHNEQNIVCHLKCPLCDSQLRKKDINQHLETFHQIEIETDYYQFATSSDFNSWKQKEEIDTKSKFVKRTGIHRGKTKSVENYVCHRSGIYVSKGKGRRKLKAQKSKKINAYCPAEMNVTITSTGECVVRYIKTHVGHSNDMRYVVLTQSERKLIASKVADKVPYERIIDELKQSRPGDFTRLNVLSKRDLLNIAYSFNLQSVVTQNRNTSRKEHLITKFTELVNKASNDNEITFLENVFQSAVQGFRPSNSEMSRKNPYSPSKNILLEQSPRKRPKIMIQYNQSYSEES